MEDLWRELLKLLTILVILFGSGEFSKMAREAFKAKLKRGLKEKVEKFEQYRDSHKP